MAVCPEPGLTGMINLNPSRCATKRIGGANKRLYIGSLSEVAGYTRTAAGELATLIMKTDKRLYTITGKKLKNSTSTEVRKNENVTLFGQTVNFVAYFDTQAEKEAIELLVDLEDAFIIVENNYGKLEAFGLVGKEGLRGEGLSVTTGTYSVEAGLDGATSMALAFTGDEAKLPVYTKFGADLLAEIDYLDALVTPAAL